MTSLIDPFGRRIDYLRISVTDRCDLRCSYCLPEGFRDFEEPAHWLSPAEIARLAGVFASLGVSRIRLTGGEPLLRRGIADIAAGIAACAGIRDLSLSTNATQLARHATALRAAGVTRLNVSLDSLDATRFAQIAGRDRLPEVLAGLAAARAAGFAPIKLNMVAVDHHSLAELDAMLAFAREGGFVLRLIETMPVGATGQRHVPLDLSRAVEQIAQRHGLLPQIQPGGGPARYWLCPRSGLSLGVITPMSQHFCASCNRVRLTADGDLLLCLGQEDREPLRPLLRAGASDAELVAAIRAGIARKPERHHFREQPAQIVRFMAQTGG